MQNRFWRSLWLGVYMGVVGRGYFGYFLLILKTWVWVGVGV